MLRPSYPFLSWVLLPVILLLLPLPMLARQQKIDFGDLEKVALKELEETNTPGAIVAIVKGDQIVFVKGFGIANIETGAPVASDMLFRIGSITKMFTATMLVMLAEEGNIKLDKPIGKYVKGLSTKLSQVTIHQLRRPA
ncbi:MAG: serine hydrolase domain-containing protein [bacterium]